MALLPAYIPLLFREWLGIVASLKPTMLGKPPGCCSPSLGFLFFLVVLEWPDLRRGLVMTFASRDSRLTVLKILNEIESGLANYLLIVSLINVGVGALAGVICWLTGMPNAIGFGALAATLNFIPIIGPIAMFAVLLVVGVVAEPTFLLGLLPAAGFLLVITVEGQFLTPMIIDASSNSTRSRSCCRSRSGPGFGGRWERSFRRRF